MSLAKAKILIPTSSTTFLGILLYHLYKPSARAPFARTVRLLIFYLLLVNWRSFPLKWHFELLRWPYLARLRWRFGSLPKLAPQISKSPFDVKLYTPGTVTWDLADWNMHLSNSSYAKLIDETRMKFWADFFGPAHARSGQKVYGALAGSSYTFYREIPVGASFEIEMSIAGWDSKYLYLMARYIHRSKKGHEIVYCIALSAYKIKTSLQPPSHLSETLKNSSPSPSGTVTPVGPPQTQQIHRKSRLTVSPGRFLSMAGFGSATNWTRFNPAITEAQLMTMSGKDWQYINGKDQKLWQQWILGDNDDGLGEYEEERKERADKLRSIIGDTEGWKKF